MVTPAIRNSSSASDGSSRSLIHFPPTHHSFVVAGYWHAFRRLAGLQLRRTLPQAVLTNPTRVTTLAVVTRRVG